MEEVECWCVGRISHQITEIRRCDCGQWVCVNSRERHRCDMGKIGRSNDREARRDYKDQMGGNKPSRSFSNGVPGTAKKGNRKRTGKRKQT